MLKSVRFFMSVDFTVGALRVPAVPLRPLAEISAGLTCFAGQKARFPIQKDWYSRLWVRIGSRKNEVCETKSGRARKGVMFRTSENLTEHPKSVIKNQLNQLKNKKILVVACHMLRYACPRMDGYTNLKEAQMKSTFAKTAAALAVLALCSGAAQAVALTGIQADKGVVGPAGITDMEYKGVPINTAFEFGWLFQIAAPRTAFSYSLNWNPNAPHEFFPSITGTVYNVNGTCTGIIGCDGTAIGSFVKSGNNLNFPSNTFADFANLGAGNYAVYFTGTTPNVPVGNVYNFSGQGSSADVPAPAVLGLVGLGLIGMGFGRKARRA
jgi:hypothetical protein